MELISFVTSLSRFQVDMIPRLDACNLWWDLSTDLTRTADPPIGAVRYSLVATPITFAGDPRSGLVQKYRGLCL